MLSYRSLRWAYEMLGSVVIEGIQLTFDASLEVLDLIGGRIDPVN